eukprot:CAMPEP_0182423766 /NCGR_PEP_ID=MMETSP1167-20130531/9855_1 /TAXON_ID=2988 /ORGANISM="Mallomonas Sp, Strain CCMP3275" /LENGTH=308 /DNA_ID=CAMNT_0024603039 /DNA_START=205 /DNA_END=1131 /DNA_ORIENTATION=+
MNKNISRWLLKEQQRKGIPIQLPPDILDLSRAVARHIFECTSDLEFGMEILMACNVSNPKVILTTATADGLNNSISNGSSSLIDGTRGTAVEANGSAVPETWVVEKRLICILERAYPEGLLGAHIPSIYKEDFGEPIHLHGRKLKDVLLGTNLIEMLGGGNSPGGKKFILRAGAMNGRHAFAGQTKGMSVIGTSQSPYDMTQGSGQTLGPNSVIRSNSMTQNSLSVQSQQWIDHNHAPGDVLSMNENYSSNRDENERLREKSILQHPLVTENDVTSLYIGEENESSNMQSNNISIHLDTQREHYIAPL